MLATEGAEASASGSKQGDADASELDESDCPGLSLKSITHSPVRPGVHAATISSVRFEVADCYRLNKLVGRGSYGAVVYVLPFLDARLSASVYVFIVHVYVSESCV